MGINGALFLEQLGNVFSDGAGFKKVLAGIDINALRDSDGTILTANTEPSREASETYAYSSVVVSSSQTDLGTLAFMIPRDYDAGKDCMAVRFLCNSGGTTDAPKLDAALYRKREGVALSVDLNPTISAAITKTSATTGAAWREIVASGLGLKPGDAVTWVFTVGGTRGTTDSVVIYAMEVVYYSDLVYNVEADR